MTVLVLGLLAAGCSASADPPEVNASIDASVTDSGEEVTTTTTEAAPSTTTSPPTTATESTTTTTTVELPVAAETAFNGRAIPPTVDSAESAAALFVEVERALRIDGQDDLAYAELGHTEQVLIRSIMRNPDWIEPFLAALPDDLRPFGELHIEARSQLSMLHAGWTPTDNIPAWTIIEPEPLDQLVSHYQSASEQTGIDWPILAGINLVETGMGRIDGVSSAGAQGPMQFLPTTWPEVSQGGDVTDPEDAIHGAARYLVQRGGLDDIRAGLWGYNNSDYYGNAVLAYAEMIRLDERSLRGFYNWEIYVGSAEGTLWLPVGFSLDEVGSAREYLAENPWAKTLS